MYIQPPYVHLGFGFPNLCRVPKWLSIKMAVISYTRLGYVPRTASNGQVFKQNTLEAPNHPTKIEAAKERILATTLPPNSKISQDPKEVYSPKSRIHSCSLPLFPFCIQLICSSHSLSYFLWTLDYYPQPSHHVTKWTFLPFQHQDVMPRHIHKHSHM